jgi:large subunit ribosomal protein L9
MIEEQRRSLQKREERERVSAQSEAERLSGVELTFSRRVGEHGLLYGSVTALDVVEGLKERGFTVERRRIGLREHIKEVGDYDITIKLHRDVSPVIKVRVLREGAPEKALSPEEIESVAQESTEAPAAESEGSEAKSEPAEET